MFISAQKILSFILCLSLSACSVVMAAKGNGVNPKDLSKCRTRACLIATGAIPVDHRKDSHGKLTSENFRGTMPTGSAARAVMHGLLDVSTIGLWEVAGTPIEGVKGKETGYVIAVKYAADGNTIQHMGFEF